MSSSQHVLNVRRFCSLRCWSTLTFYTRCSSLMATKSDEETTNRRCKVNPRLVPGKLYYLTQFGCWVCLHPFFTVYYRSLGLSARQAGIIQAVGEFFTILSPIGGLIGDKLKKPKLAWIVSIMGQFVFGMIIGLAFKPDANFQWTRSYCHCNQTEMLWVKIDSDVTTDCSKLKTWEGSWSKTAIFVFLASLLYFVYGSVCGLGDSYVLATLDKPGDYGKQRAWGSISWGLVSALVGRLTDVISSCGYVNYDVHFYSFAVCLWLSIICAALVRPKTNVRGSSVSIMKSIRVLISQPDVCVFFIGIFFIGIGMVIVESFLFFFLEDLGATQTLLGLTIMMRASSQVAVFFLSGTIVKFLGNHGAVAFALIAFCIRFISYSFLTNPWYALIIEPLHGFTFGLSLASTASFLSITSPLDLQAGAQTIGYAVRCGLGKGLGNIVYGFVYHQFGAIVTFRSVVVVLAIGLTLFWSLHLVARNRSPPMASHTVDEEKDEDDETKPLVVDKHYTPRRVLYSHSDGE